MTRAADNPFATHRLESIPYRPQGWTWDELMARLVSLKYRCAIVGPHGSGKTTLLDALAPRLRDRGLEPVTVRLTSEFPRLVDGVRSLAARLDSSNVLLLDGAEQLSRLTFARLVHATRHGAGFIATSHHPLRLPTLIETATTPQLLASLVDELGASICAGSAERAAGLWEAHHGNIRDALLDLYDKWQRPPRDTPSPPPIEYIEH